MKRILILLTFLIIPSLMIAPVVAQTQTLNQQTKPASQKSVGESDTAPATTGEPQTMDAQKDINQKIQELQKQVDTLREQGRTREKLTITAEEKAEKEKSVLTAAGREYTLMPRGKLELEYSLRYEYISSSEIISSTQVEPRANHTVRNGIGVQYGLLNNVTFNTNIPFVYVYDKTGTSDSKKNSDLGDVTLGLDYQPFKSSDWPTTTIAISAILPTGTSPYKVNRDTDLPTGNGLYGATLGLNMSKSIDPAMAFGGISCTYRFKRNDLTQNMGGVILDSIEPGTSFSAAVGMAYAISYAVSMNTQFQYGYNMSTHYYFTNGSEHTTSAYSNASFIIGTGWRVSSKTTLSFSVGVGLTNNDPDFFFLFRLPFSF